MVYLHGIGVEQNIQEALIWYAKSGEQGNVAAQYELGRMYSGMFETSNGKQIPKDMKKVLYWHRKAAKEGLKDSQYELGVCYYTGNGVKKDIQEAIRWYKLSANQGFKFADTALKNEAQQEVLSELAAVDVGFGKNPFRKIPMVVGSAYNKKEALWVIVDDAWGFQAMYSKKTYVLKVIKIAKKYGLSTDAVTIRNRSTGKELAFVEEPWNEIYFGETTDRIPDYMQKQLPPGLRWENP